MTGDPVVVVAVATPRPGHEDRVLEAIREAIPAVHAEDGCLRYALHQAPGSGEFVMVEQWASAEALAAHQQGEPLAGLVAALDGALAAPLQVHRVQAVPAGLPEKGAL